MVVGKEYYFEYCRLEYSEKLFCFVRHVLTLKMVREPNLWRSNPLPRHWWCRLWLLVAVGVVYSIWRGSGDSSPASLARFRCFFSLEPVSIVFDTSSIDMHVIKICSIYKYFRLKYSREHTIIVFNFVSYYIFLYLECQK